MYILSSLIFNDIKGFQESGIKKGDISVALSSLAPQGGLFSNRFWDELRVYATLNYLFIQVMKNHEVGLILVVLAILL
jgi:hypothetical protein